MRSLALVLLSVGCLDFEPGTPNALEDGGAPPTKMGDMAKPATQPPPPDMAQAPTPGADMAGAPPAPLGVMLCETDLALTGTYVQGTAPAADFPGGCWPDGTWTFTVAVTTAGCTPAPPLEAQYQFKVVEDLDFNDTITYVNDPTNMYVATKISGGEGGVCVGAFMIFSADGKTVYNLRPAMQADNSINGAGDVRVYDADQRL